MSTPPFRVKRVLAELLVITASILLAFSLEAWWGERVERVRFGEVVLAVRAEFSGGEAELARARAIHEATADAIRELLTLVGPDPGDAAIEALQPLWAEVRFTSTDVPRGVLSNLLASGDISALPDAGLRQRLSAWPAALQDHLGTERMYADAMDHLRLLASERSPIPPGYGAPEYESAFPARPGAILTDFTVENALWRTLLLLEIVIEENRALGDSVAETLNEVDAYIDGG